MWEAPSGRRPGSCVVGGEARQWIEKARLYHTSRRCHCTLFHPCCNLAIGTKEMLAAPRRYVAVEGSTNS
jgi:hypothetical protein